MTKKEIQELDNVNLLANLASVEEDMMREAYKRGEVTKKSMKLARWILEETANRFNLDFEEMKSHTQWKWLWE